jgi:hypothetical protein
MGDNELVDNCMEMRIINLCVLLNYYYNTLLR